MSSLIPKRGFESILNQQRGSLDSTEQGFHNIVKCKKIRSNCPFIPNCKYLLISFPRMPYKKSEAVKINYRIAEFSEQIGDDRLIFTDLNSKEYISLPKIFSNKYWVGVPFI